MPSKLYKPMTPGGGAFLVLAHRTPKINEMVKYRSVFGECAR